MQAATPAAETADFGNRLSAVESRLSRLEGINEQLDKRLTAVEQRLATVERRLDWIIGLIFTSWLSIVGLILWKLG